MRLQQRRGYTFGSDGPATAKRELLVQTLEERDERQGRDERRGGHGKGSTSLLEDGEVRGGGSLRGHS